MVGAPGKTVGANSSQGAAYLFNSNGGHVNWTQVTRYTASDGGTNDALGNSVALFVDTNGLRGINAVAGAWGHNGNQGAIYFFPGSEKFVAPTAVAQDAFGWAVATSANGTVVGAND